MYLDRRYPYWRGRQKKSGPEVKLFFLFAGCYQVSLAAEISFLFSSQIASKPWKFSRTKHKTNDGKFIYHFIERTVAKGRGVSLEAGDGKTCGEDCDHWWGPWGHWRLTGSQDGPASPCLVFALQSLAPVQEAGAGQHLEDDLHVVWGAVAALPAHHVARPGGWDEEVILPGLELHRVGHRGEGAEGESEDPEGRQITGRESEWRSYFLWYGWVQ